MATYTVKQGDTITDAVLNSLGDISFWDAFLTENNYTDWTPALSAGQVLAVPVVSNANVNNVRQFASYPLNNASVPDVYAKIISIFDSMLLITTDSVTSITNTSAACGGVIAENPGTPITQKGVCWSLSPNPTISDSHTNEGAGNDAFTSSITGLSAGNTYYVRAYGVNSSGVIYGQQQTFGTPNVILDTVAGANYSAAASSTGNILLVLEIQNEDTSGHSITNIAGILTGSNLSNDIAASAFKVYRNSTPNLSGSPALALSLSVSGTTAWAFSQATSIYITNTAPRYLIFTVDIAAGAITGDTISIQGAVHPIELTWDASVVQQNNQNNTSPIITIS